MEYSINSQFNYENNYRNHDQITNEKILEISRIVRDELFGHKSHCDLNMLKTNGFLNKNK